MPEPIKNLLDRIKEWWLKFNNKQRALFIIGVLLVIVVIIVLVVIFGRTEQKKLKECSSEAEAVEVRTLLTDANITATITEDNVIYVDEKDYLEAKLTLGSSNISSSGYSFSDAVSSSFTDTEAITQEKYVQYLRYKFQADLESLSQVKSARVNIMYKDTSNNVFAEDMDYSITAILTLNRELSDEQCEAIGKLLATNVGSDNTNSVYVIDSSGNTLYAGSTNNGSTTATAANKIRVQFENAIISKATDVFEAAGYNDVSVLPNLEVNFDNVEIVSHNYKAPEGTEQGLYSTSYEVNSEGALADASGVAGSESNDNDTSYDIQNTDGGTSTYSLRQYGWLQDEVITTTTKASGEVVWDNSSMAVVASKTTFITEERAEELGYITDEVTWADYKEQHSEPAVIEITDEVKDQYLELLSAGSGIPKTKISFVAYQTYKFFDKELSDSNPWLILQIALAVLIAAALVFIIVRSMKPVAVEETEPELSVEDMLATTKQQTETVEDIALQDKSETRKAIEKFVNDNPEAVAVLLRNWLNEGWG